MCTLTLVSFYSSKAIFKEDSDESVSTMCNKQCEPAWVQCGQAAILFAFSLCVHRQVVTIVTHH